MDTQRVPHGKNRSFLRRIPGFRTASPWKMALASFGYAFMLIFVFGLVLGLLSKGPVEERPSVAETPLAPVVTKSEVGPKAEPAPTAPHTFTEPVLAEREKNSAGEEAAPGKTIEEKNMDDKKNIENKSGVEQQAYEDRRVTEVERQAYEAWKDTYEKLLQEIGDSWKILWKDTMFGLANKTIDYRTAANRLIVLDGRLGIIQKNLESLRAPGQLTAEHQALLNESADLTSRMVAAHREGVQLVLEFLQGGGKDKLDSGLARIAGADLYLVAAVTKEEVVRNALGVKD